MIYMVTKTTHGLIISLIACFLVAIPYDVRGKRGPKPETVSILWGDTTIQSFDNYLGNGKEFGVSLNNNKGLTSVTIYSISYDSSIERDIQPAYITALSVVNNVIIIATERDGLFCYNLVDKTISMLNAPKNFKISNIEAVSCTNKKAVNMDFYIQK